MRFGSRGRTMPGVRALENHHVPNPSHQLGFMWPLWRNPTAETIKTSTSDAGLKSNFMAYCKLENAQCQSLRNRSLIHRLAGIIKLGSVTLFVIDMTSSSSSQNILCTAITSNRILTHMVQKLIRPFTWWQNCEARRILCGLLTHRWLSLIQNKTYKGVRKIWKVKKSFGIMSFDLHSLNWKFYTSCCRCRIFKPTSDYEAIVQVIVSPLIQHPWIKTL